MQIFTKISSFKLSGALTESDAVKRIDMNELLVSGNVYGLVNVRVWVIL